MKKWVACVAGGLVLFSSVAAAHTDEYLDTISGPHGGQLRMAGPSHYEMVITPSAVQIYVTDHANTPTSVSGATGSAMLVNGKSKQQVTLTQKGENLLEGAGTFLTAEPTRAVVKVQLKGQEAQQVLFDTSKHKPASGHEGH